MSDMAKSGSSSNQSIPSGDIHLSPQHCLPDIASLTSLMNEHSLHERSYIQCSEIMHIMITYIKIVLDIDRKCLWL